MTDWNQREIAMRISIRFQCGRAHTNRGQAGYKRFTGAILCHACLTVSQRAFSAIALTIVVTESAMQELFADWASYFRYLRLQVNYIPCVPSGVLSSMNVQ